MSGISCLEQPAGARSDVRLTSGLGQRHQPYRKTRHTIDQGLVEAEWKTSAFNLEMTQLSALTSYEENYFTGKLNEPLALFDANTLTLFDIGWKTPDVIMAQLSALTPIEENYFIPKLGEPTALFDANTLTLFDTGWKTSDVKMTQPSVLPPIEQNYLSGKVNEPTALLAANTLRLFETDWKTSVVSVLAATGADYLSGKVNEPTALLAANTLRLFETDWKTSVVSVLAATGADYLSGKVNEPTALLAASTLKFLGTGWKTSIVTINRPSVLTLLEDTYVIENRREVSQFVEENQLGGLLKQARDPINKAFGEKAVKTLTVVEDDEGFRTLFCLVMIPGDMQEARNALKAFDEEWWLQYSPKVSGKLNFDFELI
jgi:hypothetical protein